MRASVDCDVSGTKAVSCASEGALECRELAIARTAKVAANARAATRSFVWMRCVSVIACGRLLTRGGRRGSDPLRLSAVNYGVGSWPGSVRFSCESNPSCGGATYGNEVRYGTSFWSTPSPRGT